jgi:hypothetical protein
MSGTNDDDDQVIINKTVMRPLDEAKLHTERSYTRKNFSSNDESNDENRTA